MHFCTPSLWSSGCSLNTPAFVIFSPAVNLIENKICPSGGPPVPESVHRFDAHCAFHCRFRNYKQNCNSKLKLF